MNYLTEKDLNAVKGLLHYLNTNFTPTAESPDLTAEIKLVDSNAEVAGSITFNADVNGYVLTPA